MYYTLANSVSDATIFFNSIFSQIIKSIVINICNEMDLNQFATELFFGFDGI